MLYWLDCEFIESSFYHPIDLVSIGIVAEDGREYYALNYDCDWNRANDWVKQNVLTQLPEKPLPQVYATRKQFQSSEAYQQGWRNRDSIAEEIIKFVYFNGHLDTSPQFWGEWCSYDWVVFCQLFGTMEDLPKGFPMRCRDIIQWAEDHLGLSSGDLPPSLETDGNHNALLGALSVRDRYYWLQEKAKEMA